MGDATTPTAQWLLIVSTKSRALFDYLSMSFRDIPNIEVILDRRGGERRGRSASVVSDRRREDRRVSRGERFPLLGYVLIRRHAGEPAAGDARTYRTLPDEAGTHRTLHWPEVRIEDLDGSRSR